MKTDIFHYKQPINKHEKEKKIDVSKEEKKQKKEKEKHAPSNHRCLGDHRI